MMKRPSYVMELNDGTNTLTYDSGDLEQPVQTVSGHRVLDDCSSVTTDAGSTGSSFSNNSTPVPLSELTKIYQ